MTRKIANMSMDAAASPSPLTPLTPLTPLVPLVETRDLMIVFAIARAGSVSAAASKLSLHQATVFRRLEELERGLGVRLFDRIKGKYQITPPGERLCQLAEHHRQTLESFRQSLQGGDLRPTGVIRVTTTDTLGNMLLPNLLAGFRGAHPGIDVELVVSNQFLTVSRREADIALRPTRGAPEHLAGRALCAVAFALYASEDYLHRHDAGLPLAEHSWVAPDESLATTTTARWMAANVPEQRVPFRVNSMLAMAAAARAGLGMAALPCYVGDTMRELRRVQGPIAELETQLWLLTHPDLRQVPRVRAFLDYLPEALRSRIALFEGQRPRGGESAARKAPYM